MTPASDRPLDARVVPLHLGRARPGDRLRILAVPSEHAAALAREGLAAGVRIDVTTAVPLGGPVVARAGVARIAVGRQVADRIVVERLP